MSLIKTDPALTDFLAFLQDPARIERALRQPGWSRTDLTALDLLDVELTLSRLICVLAGDSPLHEWPLEWQPNKDHWGYGAIEGTLGEPVIYGMGGFHRFHETHDGSIRMSAPHIGSGYRQTDRVVLCALWLGIPTYNVTWAAPLTQVRRLAYRSLKRAMLKTEHPQELQAFMRAVGQYAPQTAIQQRLERIGHTLPPALAERILDYVTDPWCVEVPDV